MTDKLQRDIELLENKANTLEVAMHAIFQAIALHNPAMGQEVIAAVESQAEACRRGGRPVAHVLLTSLSERLAVILADSQ
jgi:hypothetical protein